ncbi:hypothetical protein AcW1_010153 [Taiwanofungus camphoratus]|nr:hypothetical protein AcW1_010153 [Antrodia cinnamomea]
MTFTTLRALHALIGTALDDIERVYRDAAVPQSPASPFTYSSQSPVSPHSSPYPSPTSPWPPPSSSSSSSVSSYSDSHSHSGVASECASGICAYSAAPATPTSPRAARRPRPILTALANSTQQPGLPPPLGAHQLPPTPASLVCPASPIAAAPRAPLDYPDLDLPFYDSRPAGAAQAEDRARDETQAQAEALTAHPEVIAATNRIVAACAQLGASVQRPFLTICDAAMGYHLPACMRFAEASHTVEILREAGPRGLHVDALAARITELRRAQLATLNASGEHGAQGREDGPDTGTGVDPQLLSHILRLLATHHVLREVRPDVFANNRVSSAFDSGHSVAELRERPEIKYEGTNGAAAFVGMCTDELFKASAYLTDCYIFPSSPDATTSPPPTNRPAKPPPAPRPPAGAPHSQNDVSEAKGLSAPPARQPSLRRQVSVPAFLRPPSQAFGRAGRSRSQSTAQPVPAAEDRPAVPPLPLLPPVVLRPPVPLHRSASPHTPPSALALQHEAAPGKMHAPFNVAFRTRAPYFEWLEQPMNAARLHRFGRAMTGTSSWEVPGAIVEGFPWQSLPPSALVVDVGGGIGSTSLLLARAFPHLRFLIQDRPQVAEMGVAAWRARCPELLDSGRAAFQAHDFFKPQPPLPQILRVPSFDRLHIHSLYESEGSGRREPEKGAEGTEAPAVFFLRVIAHDWPDAYVTRILLPLRRAAGPNTKLLLAEYVLPLACMDEDVDAESDTDGEISWIRRREPLPGTVRTLAPEGSPLLPNLGRANANAYWLDLTMRCTFNSQERTLRELAALTRTAGWRIVQVTRAEGSLFGYIVAVPVEIPSSTLAALAGSLPQSGSGTCGNPGEEAAAQDAVNEEIQCPPMGDTFCSFMELPSEDTMRKGSRFRTGWGGARTSHSYWQSLIGGNGRSGKKSLNLVGPSATAGNVKDSQARPALVPLTSPQGLLPALEPTSNSRRGDSKGTGRNQALDDGWKGLRRVLSRAQLGFVRSEKQPGDRQN